MIVVTPRYINNLREKSFIKISADTEKLILEQFGSAIKIDDEGHQHTYTEQDIFEQIRKMIR